MRNRVFVGLLVLLLAAGAYALWIFYGRQAKENNNLVSASGTIEATEVKVSSQIAGLVEQVRIKEGDLVEEDEVLLKLDDTLLQDKVALAQADLDAARANLSKVESAEDARQLTAQDVEIAQSKVKQAEIALRVAQTQSSFATVKSPRKGIVLTVSTNPGEVVSPGVPLVTIGDIDEVELVIYIREDELGKVKPNQRVRVKVDSYPGRTFPGRVSLIASEAEFTPSTVQTKEERITTVYAVKITLNNKDHVLKPGMPADAEIETGGK